MPIGPPKRTSPDITEENLEIARERIRRYQERGELLHNILLTKREMQAIYDMGLDEYQRADAGSEEEEFWDLLTDEVIATIIRIEKYD